MSVCQRHGKRLLASGQQDQGHLSSKSEPSLSSSALVGWEGFAAEADLEEVTGGKDSQGGTDTQERQGQQDLAVLSVPCPCARAEQTGQLESVLSVIRDGRSPAPLMSPKIYEVSAAACGRPASHRSSGLCPGVAARSPTTPSQGPTATP